MDGETTRYTYDDANQLVSSIAPDGSVTRFRHNAAGRLVHAGDVAYRHDAWGRVTEIVRAGVTVARLEYGIDGQLARITRSDGTVEEFVWDGLALVWRGGVAYVNEPAPTGGNPVLAGDAPILTDILGSSVALAGDIIDMSAFGKTARHDAFFTGKPYVEGLGYVFLLRNYCPQLGRWSAADPLGYPDGWNNRIYLNNDVSLFFDYLGALKLKSDSGMPPIPESVTSSIMWLSGANNSIFGIYSITNYSWNLVGMIAGGNCTLTLSVVQANTTNESEIFSFSNSLEQSITNTANVKGSFANIAEFSSSIASSASATCSGGFQYTVGNSSTTSVAIGFSTTVSKDEYAELIAYQLTARTDYYGVYYPESLPEEAIPPRQNLGIIASFSANLFNFAGRTKIYAIEE